MNWGAVAWVAGGIAALLILLLAVGSLIVMAGLWSVARGDLEPDEPVPVEEDNRG